ncbi:MAG: PQQ-binding-like beta-propeller repeat protein, partial [Actinomycetota bacterium]|nr:PQQ-binding-like beta-propeller repeat protein [Actinomycetota bacterium]
MRGQPTRPVGRALAIVAISSLALAPQSSARANITTNNRDAARTGWYPDQPGLSPAVVGGGSFGQEFSAAVDGQVYAQPVLAGGTLLVATQNNKVYGLDPNTGTQKWVRSLGTPWNTADIGCGDINPHVGVMATPTIDATTSTAYLTNKTYVSGTSGNAVWLM